MVRLDHWTCDLKINRDHLLIGLNPCNKFGIDQVKGSKDIEQTTQWAKKTCFDFDLWTCDLKINRDHLLIESNPCTKFGIEAKKKYMCVSGYPTLPIFWGPKIPTLNFFFFYNLWPKIKFRNLNQTLEGTYCSLIWIRDKYCRFSSLLFPFCHYQIII